MMSALVVGAVYATLPKFTVREVVVDHVVEKDVAINNPVPHDVPINNPIPHDVVIEVPRIVTKDFEPSASLAPRSSEERTLEGSEAWRGADVRGRILRPDHNGFVLMTDSGEQSFYPARIGADGKAEADESMKDVVNGLLNDLAYCRPQGGLYQCVALHEGRETPIPEIPIVAKRGRPA